MRHRIHRLLSVLCCLLVGVSSLGCAASLSLEYLKSLNPSVYAGPICGVPKGAAPGIHFYAVNAAMDRIVTDRNPEALKRFMLVADSVHEVQPWAPISSANTVPISMAVSCAARETLPPDLQTELDTIVAAAACKTAGKKRPNPQLLGQTWVDGRDPLAEMRDKMLATVLKWAVHEATAADPRIAVPSTYQLIPLPPVEWEPSTPVAEDEPLSTLEHPVTQFSSGAVAGASIGAVPFGPLGADVAIELRLLPKGTYWARVGKACGEIVIGTGQMIFGCAGMGAGAGMSGTGGGAAVGVPVIVGSYAIAANGCATAGHGLAEAHQLFRDGDVSAASSAPAPPRLVLKKGAKKPAAQAPVAEAPPAAKPATVPTETTTTTRSTGPSGETITTVTKKSGTTTTTRGKGKPSTASAEAAPVAKPRGGDSPAAARGRQAHKEFEQKTDAKEGWKSNPHIKDKKTGKISIPDATTRNGNPIELKPNTPSGRAAGRRQMKKYEAVTRKKGRVLYYDP